MNSVLQRENLKYVKLKVINMMMMKYDQNDEQVDNENEITTKRLKDKKTICI